MELAQKKKYYNLCDPYRVATDDKYILDIDGFEIDGRAVHVRGEKWADDIVTKVSWSDEPQIIYFTGYAGSGKTTELQRILARLESEEEGNLLPVYINSSDFIDINSPVDLTDIFTVIVYNIIITVGAYQGKSEDEIFGEKGYFGRLWEWLNHTDVSLETLEFESNGAKFVANLKETPKFRRAVKQAINDHFSTFKKDVFLEINELNKLVKSYEKDGKKKDGIVVVLDQLEKNRGTSSNVDEVQEAIERVFANRNNLELPVDVIYTLPPYLSIKKSIGDIHFLPAVRVVNKDNSPCSDGIEVMKAFIEKRIPSNGLEEIFSREYQLPLEKIIIATGGYPRDLLKAMQQVIQVKSYPVNDERLTRVLTQFDNQFQEFLLGSSEYREELARIYVSKQLENNDKILYDLFTSHAILRYKNGDLWYTLHPSVKKLLGL
jgi:hypothetical protein